MDNLKFYRIDLGYIKYLWGYDKRVQYAEDKPSEYTERRPYIGIVYEIGDYTYFAPLEHPRPDHDNIKNNSNILKMYSGKSYLGLIAFNNMIPVKKEYLINFKFANEKNERILIKQLIFYRKNRQIIYDKALNTYNKVKHKEKFFTSICCDFKLLEEKMLLF